MMIGKCVRINTCATLALWKEAHCSSVAGAQFLSTVDSTLAGAGWGGTAHTAHTHARAAPRSLDPAGSPRRVAHRALSGALASAVCARCGRGGCWKLENQTVRSNASVLWGAGTARLLASA